MLLENHIKIHEDQFTKADHKIAQYLISNQNEVMYASLSEFSKVVNVGEATIVRFCKKIGLKGFQELKITIAKQYNIGDGEKLTENNYINLIAGNMAKVIEDTKNIIRKNDLDEAIRMLKNGKRIYFYGVGASGLSALEAEGRFVRIGYRTNAVTESHYQVMNSVLLTKEDVLVVLSLSGSSKDLNKAVEIAKEGGAKIIAVTNYFKSPLAMLADTVLLTAGREKPIEGGSLIAKVSQLFVIDLLCTGLSLTDYERTMQIKEKTMNAVFQKKE